MKYSFSNSGGNIYLTYVQDDIIRVYKNKECQPVLEIKAEGQRKFTSGAYSEDIICFSYENNCGILNYIEKNIVKELDFSMIMNYEDISVKKYLFGGSGNEFVLEGITKDSEEREIIIYDIKNKVVVAYLPLTNGFMDVEYYNKDSLLQLTNHVSYEEDDDDEMLYRIITFKADSFSKKEPSLMKILKLLDVYSGIYTRETWEGTYSSREISHGLHFPLFNKYLYYWPKDVSVSAYGNYFLQYNKDINGLIIGNLKGDVEFYFEIPDECKEASYYYFDENRSELYCVMDDEIYIYSVSQNKEMIQEVNNMYNETANNVSLQKNITFEKIFYKCLFSAKIFKVGKISISE